MAQSTLIQVRVDDSIKKTADALFSDLGLDTPTAIRIFLAQAIKRHGLPFDVIQKIPNDETMAAIDDVNNRRNLSKTFHSVAELMEDLNA